MMWVNDILPPWWRLRWLLRISRLTSRSLAETVRTDVAVGTSRDSSIRCAITRAAPLRG
jgi:hypothetical protein